MAAGDGLRQHTHVLTFIGFVSLRGTPASKFTCSVDDCPYNPAAADVAASQAMQIQESIAKRIAGLLRGNAGCNAGVCVLCGEADADVVSNHLAICPYRLAVYFVSGSLTDDAGSTNSGLVDDSTTQ